jgi:hypothetical protein
VPAAAEPVVSDEEGGGAHGGGGTVQAAAEPAVSGKAGAAAAAAGRAITVGIREEVRRWKARTRHVSPFKHPLAPTREKQPGQHSPSHSCSPHSHIPAAGAGPCRLRGQAAAAGPCRLRGAGPCRLRGQAAAAGCGGCGYSSSSRLLPY